MIGNYFVEADEDVAGEQREEREEEGEAAVLEDCAEKRAMAPTGVKFRDAEDAQCGS